ncbi:MAG: ASKHA domain-containing protein [Terriglobia bacterium]
MTDQPTFRVTLRPVQTELTAPAGTALRDLLFSQGVEFPCGGQGRCRGCRVRVLEGHVAVNDPQRERLSAEELAQGWRLACQCTLEDDLVVELRQWDAAILVDDTPFAFQPRGGLGVAVDLGTTTLVAQLLDLDTGRVLAVRTALNSQARFGADVMSRVQFAVPKGGAKQLRDLIRQQIGSLIEQLVFAAQIPQSEIKDVVVVGNTVMHHLFCGLDVEPLSRYPFEPEHIGLQTLGSGDLGWKLSGPASVRFLPCLGGFVGSDILAGILATRLGEREDLNGLVDLGTNGEIVIGNRERLLCASTAAGPAFEGARISMGMRASTGAISEVMVENRAVHCRVLGNVPPQGLCGSGLVDAVAAGLQLGRIQPSGRFTAGASAWELSAPVVLTQSDIRELQLAKGAIAAGIRMLLDRFGASAADLKKLYLAGAFGNYINRASAQRIGLINFPAEKVEAAGNTALLGAKLALFRPDGDDGSFARLRRQTEHVALNADQSFQETFVEEMAFPDMGAGVRELGAGENPEPNTPNAAPRT